MLIELFRDISTLLLIVVTSNTSQRATPGSFRVVPVPHEPNPGSVRKLRLLSSDGWQSLLLVLVSVPLSWRFGNPGSRPQVLSPIPGASSVQTPEAQFRKSRANASVAKVLQT